ncbi:metabotropic glutamate receptor 2-like [Watersipora subatra]|uniref:metabotropic glutamate receptor 2-like n=1 Tax=Watersipora subatra TaxID=2589382 RepID=UPI00355B8038
MLLQFILLLLPYEVYGTYQDIAGLPNTSYKLDGDIIIGGVFPLHQAGHDHAFCGPLRELGVLQRAEAMAFYIREINKNASLLPGINLGFIILDDCYKENAALARGLQFIPQGEYGIGNKSHSAHQVMNEVVAVVGAESSTNSKQLAELLGLFAIPQISYLSTSPILGDDILYPYFSRIVPSDNHQIRALIDLMEYYNWSYVSFVYSLSFYGIYGYLIMLGEVKRSSSNICFAATVGLPENPTKENFSNAIDSLIAGTNGKPSHVVMLFLSQTSATGILKAAQERHLIGKFTWIGSDAWGRNERDFSGIEDVAEGVLTIKFASKNDPSFDDHFSKLNPFTTQNPFLREFWNESCKLRVDKCGRNTTFGQLKEVWQPEMTVGLVKIAIYAIAESLQELLGRCKYQIHRNSSVPCSGKEFRDYITGDDLQALLSAMEGDIDGEHVSVTMGEGNSKYMIMNYQYMNPRKYGLTQVGSYDTLTGRLEMPPHDSPIVSWNPKINSSNFNGSVPLSICSTECKLGQKQTRLDFIHSKCCWECTNCQSNEYTKITVIEDLPAYQCDRCSILNTTRLTIFTTPTDSKDTCEIVIPQSISWSDPVAITILIIDVICIIATLILLIIYLKNRQEKLIKATSLELSYVIWTGVLCSYLSIFVYFMPLQSGCDTPARCDPIPNMHWCYIQYVIFSLSFTVIIAPMLTRANRIYRIFNIGNKGAAKPRFIENRYQLLFAGVMILIQMVIIICCSVASHFTQGNNMSMDITNRLDEVDITRSYIACEIPLSMLLPPVVYNLLLGLACAYHAFKTRRLPDNFKESRFIGMTVYTTIIMWIAFIPAYLSLNSHYYKGVPLSVAMLINSLITTSCLFVPRLYALRWVERRQMNLRSMSMSLQSFTDKPRCGSVANTSASRSRPQSTSSPAVDVTPPDIISTACYQNVAADIQAHETNSSPTVTFQDSDTFKFSGDVQFDSSEYPV